jgi:hypothetical protein
VSEHEKKILRTVEGRPGQMVYWCPGCQCGHYVWVAHPQSKGCTIWGWNGSMDKPTFNPSIKVTAHRPLTAEEQEREDRGSRVNNAIICHFYIRDGSFHYCSDSHHKFAGQVIPMEAF